MKHRFLLDSNIIYYAVKGEDEYGKPDPTSAELARLIGHNCHTAFADAVLFGKYQRHIGLLFGQPRHQVQAANFLVQLLLNSAKMCVERGQAPELPPNVKVPREDEHVVRAALLVSDPHPTLVTADQDLCKAIKRHRDVLGLSVMSPNQALELAKDS